MPRQARIDYPSALHHVIVRGTQRDKIFHCKTDYEEFIARLERILSKTTTPCYAWTLMPNHFHLLLMTGNKPISHVMQSLLTGYAMYFNKRHQRCGHVYQNRYKSILCSYDSYLLELVRYIHLNPIRGGLVKDINGLENFQWSGHRTILGFQNRPWQYTKEVLQLFGKNYNNALKNYRQFIAEGIKNEKIINFDGGGLIRSTGGIWEIIKAKQSGESLYGDERMLGDSDFVENVLKFTKEQESKRSLLTRKGTNIYHILKRAANLLDIPIEQICSKNKNRKAVKARAIVCKWLNNELGMNAINIAKELNVTYQTVLKGFIRGQKIIEDKDYKLYDTKG
jgi:putative transposase